MKTVKATTVTINDKEIKAIDSALVGIGSLLDLIKAHKDDLKSFHDNKLMPVLLGRAFGVATDVIAQRGKLDAALLTVGQFIQANKAEIDKELLAKVKSTAKARASQLYKEAGISHPYTKASAPKGAAIKASKPAKVSKLVKTAKVAAPKMPKIETAAQAIAALLENENRGAVFARNNPNFISKEVALYMIDHLAKLKTLLEKAK